MFVIAKLVITYIHRDVHTKHMRYVNVHSLTHTHFHTSNSSTRKKISVLYNTLKTHSLKIIITSFNQGKDPSLLGEG